MKRFCFVFSLLSATLWTVSAYADVGCLPNETFETETFSGEVYGDHDFVPDTSYRRLALRRHATGWRIEIIREDGSVAPARSKPLGIPSIDSLQIRGEDFRNSENTASRPASKVRKFIFGRDALDPAQNPDLRVPAPPSREPVNVITVEPQAGEMGLGELIIEDIGLADLDAGQTPRLTYLKFSGCLGWGAPSRQEGWRGSADPGVPDEVVLTMRRCGLDERRFALSDHVTGWGERGSNPALSADMDGDGRDDMIAPIRQIEPEQHGVAVCMAGDNRMILAGFDTETQDVGKLLKAGDFWTENLAPIRPGSLYPRAVGQGFTVGITRGPELFVYLDESGAVHMKRQNGR